MKEKSMSVKEAGSLGGNARMASTTPEQRSEIARLGWIARRNLQIAESRETVKAKKLEK